MSDIEGSEVIFAVRLRYGRIVIFYGIILYSVRLLLLIYEGKEYLLSVSIFRRFGVFVVSVFNFGLSGLVWSFG